VFDFREIHASFGVHRCQRLERSERALRVCQRMTGYRPTIRCRTNGPVCGTLARLEIWIAWMRLSWRTGTGPASGCNCTRLCSELSQTVPASLLPFSSEPGHDHGSRSVARHWRRGWATG